MRFSSQIGWTFATRLLMIFNSVVAGVIVAWWLGADGVGQLAVINVAVTTIVQLGSFGLPSSNTYFIAQDQSHFRVAAINSLVFALGTGTLLALALSVIASLRPDWFGFVPTDLIRIAALSIPFQLVTLIGLNILLAVGKIREFNLLDLAGQSFVLINAVLVLLLLKRGLGTLITFNTLASILVAIVIAVLLVISAKYARPVKMARRRRAPATHDRLRSEVSHFNSRGRDNHSRRSAGRESFSRRCRSRRIQRRFTVCTLLMLLPGVIATLLFPRVTTEQDARGETTCLVVVTRHSSCCLLPRRGSFQSVVAVDLWSRLSLTRRSCF